MKADEASSKQLTDNITATDKDGN